MDLMQIKDQVSRVVEYSQEITDAKVDTLIDQWKEAKRDFLELFHGEPIFEFPNKVSFEIGPREKELRVNDFIQLIETTYDNQRLADFIRENREGFFSNKVMHNYKTETISINEGMKLLKAFKFFEDDKTVLDKLQIAASMIIQENKIEGRLCLSVHPLDFLSSSENNHNWRSCHALDGDYRAGNLSYMLDSSTVICYLRSDKEEVLPNFPPEVPWNSKKWRVLLFFSDSWDLLFAGRQYPFSTESGINFVKDKLLPYAGLSSWSDWTSDRLERMENGGMDFFFSSPYIPVGRVMRRLDDIIQDTHGALHFNDLLHSSCYTPIYSYRTRTANGIQIPVTMNNATLHIGGVCNCLKCNRAPIKLTESMMCDDCELEYGVEEREDVSTCPCCGRRFMDDYGGWVAGADELICEDCFDEYTATCGCCDENYYKDDLWYDRDKEIYICKECKAEMEEEF